MARHIKCGTLFDGLGDDAESDQTLVIEDGLLTYVGPSDKAPQAEAGDEIVDHSKYFVMPGLTDIHTHLSYGNAQCEEDIDLYAAVEFRAIRAVLNAQRLLAAGYTSMADPGGSARVPISARDAINAGMFPGPRITCSGPYITSRQGLTDYYPSWFGCPETSIGHLVQNVTEAIEVIRAQVKDGVDFVKFAMDGKQLNDKGELVASFNQAETTKMVTECHRLGKKVVMHARGREGTLYSARAAADVIFHASWMDEEGLAAVLENGCAICPTLTLPYNNITFTQPSDPSFKRVRPDIGSAEWAVAMKSLSTAHKAGVPFMTGTDSGFAITPYGEWHAREIDLFVKYLGFTPAEALRSATSVSASFLSDGERLGALAAGRHADLIVVDGNPLMNVSVLLDKALIKEVYLAGDAIALDLPPIQTQGVSTFSYRFWQDMYDQERVKALGAEGGAIRHIEAA